MRLSFLPAARSLASQHRPLAKIYPLDLVVSLAPDESDNDMPFKLEYERNYKHADQGAKQYINDAD